MSRHVRSFTRFAALAFALVATAARSQEVHLAGNLGAGYSASLSESFGATPSGSSGWDLIASLDAFGSLYSQQILRWRGEVDYGTRQTSFFGTRSIADRLTFNLTVDALNGSRFPVGLHASRAAYDFTLGTGGPLSLGSTIVNTYGINASFLGQGLAPRFHVDLSHSDTETRALNLARTLSSTTRLSLGTSQAVGPLSYSARYNTSWATGSMANLRYQFHDFNLQARTSLAKDMELLLSESYSLRLPTGVDPFNPRVDRNTVSGTFQWRPGVKQNVALGYQYANGMATSPTLLDQTNVSHGLNYAHSYRLNPELLLQGDAGARYEYARSGAVSVRGFGQTVGGGAWWMRPFFGVDTTLHTRAHVGLVEPSNAPLGFQWGTVASAAASRSLGTLNASASYEIAYQRGGVTLLGWELRQQVRADCQAPLGRDASASFSLIAAATRRTDRLFGSGFSRNVTLTGSGRWLAYTARVSAGVFDGLAPNLASGGIADGLFLPPSFDSHTRFLTGELGTGALGGSLQLVLVGRLASIEGPGIRPQTEQALSATAYYTIGLVNLSLDYRFLTMSSSGGWARSHTVFARITRSFRFL